MAVFHRVLLKLSGEALKSGKDIFDFDKVNEIASVIKRMHDMDVEIGIVIGAGNIWRGRHILSTLTTASEKSARMWH